MSDTPSVLFVCVHNAGRSQMAAGFLDHLAEVGIDISNQTPKILTPDAVETSDVVITMGCGDACPVFPGVSYRDWALPVPAGKGVDAVRPIRDRIKTLVGDLIAELVPAQTESVR